MCAEIGVDSSSRISFRARKNTDTQSHADATLSLSLSLKMPHFVKSVSTTEKINELS